ncbi:DNA-directed RNA polymerase subunit beta [Paenibacillus gansuensis]|uniref:DNA-directed RNA polymerase subunit beta n=1 Tax=Paenibacillus gansuensis TaxID=306542 RepID=A0ABW5PKT1_9BACL
MSNLQESRPAGRPRWLRILLRTSRILLVPVLCVLAVIAGLIAGYVYLGGQPLSEALQWSTWVHVFDLVFSNE